MNQLAKAKIFTTIDLADAYNQVPMRPDSRKFTAFACEFGFFQFCSMPQGLTNAVATFQRLMDRVLNEFIGTICFVYLDDIIVFSISIDEHETDYRSTTRT